MATGDEKIVHYLQEARATEEALVRTLQAHIAMTPRGDYRGLLERHLRETRGHRDRVDKRLADLGQGRGVLELGVGALQSMVGQVLALSKGPLDVMRGETGEEKLLSNAKDEAASEALEIATYRSLEALARHVGDERTAQLAERNRADEEKALAALIDIIPSLTEAAARAQVVDPSYDASTTGAADAARDAATRGREALASTRRLVLDASRDAYERMTTAARDALEQVADAAERGGDVVEATSRAALAGMQETTRQAESAIREATDAARRSAEQTADVARGGARETAGTARDQARRTRTQTRHGQTRARSGSGSGSRSGGGSGQPWPGYDDQKVAEINKRLTRENNSTIRKARDYERRNKKRSTILQAIDGKLS